MTKFGQNRFQHLNRLKNHIRGCKWVKHQYNFFLFSQLYHWSHIQSFEFAFVTKSWPVRTFLSYVCFKTLWQEHFLFKTLTMLKFAFTEAFSRPFLYYQWWEFCNNLEINLKIKSLAFTRYIWVKFYWVEPISKPGIDCAPLKQELIYSLRLFFTV